MKSKLRKKLDRIARIMSGRAKNETKRVPGKKNAPTPKNPQKPNRARRRARADGSKKAWRKFRQISREKARRNINA